MKLKKLSLVFSLAFLTACSSTTNEQGSNVTKNETSQLQQRFYQAELLEHQGEKYKAYELFTEVYEQSKKNGTTKNKLFYDAARKLAGIELELVATGSTIAAATGTPDWLAETFSMLKQHRDDICNNKDMDKENGERACNILNTAIELFKK